MEWIYTTYVRTNKYDLIHVFDRKTINTKEEYLVNFDECLIIKMNCLESYDVNAEYADDKKLIRNCNLKKKVGSF